MTVRDALRLATQAALDLIEVKPQAEPPVCRIADYGRTQYQASKKDKAARRGQKTNDLKQIRFRPHINDHDLESKTNKIRQFIKQCHKVKLTVRFRGREIAHSNLGSDLLRRIATSMTDEVKLESKPKNQGRDITMTLILTQRDSS
jgi:translation initiation factor IF-3